MMIIYLYQLILKKNCSYILVRYNIPKVKVMDHVFSEHGNSCDDKNRLKSYVEFKTTESKMMY